MTSWIIGNGFTAPSFYLTLNYGRGHIMRRNCCNNLKFNHAYQQKTMNEYIQMGLPKY